MPSSAAAWDRSYSRTASAPPPFHRARASSFTWCSTAPPPTVPVQAPPGPTSIQVPTPRGAEPCFSMMVHSTPGPGGGGVAAGPRRARSATSWAAMDTAISAGACPPMGRPMGAWTASRVSLEKPAPSRAWRTAATLVRLPIMPT